MDTAENYYASATFEKMRDLLKTKDDTSRFVGLALLKTVLDNNQLLQEPERLRTLWEVISPKFLDRLLRARQNDKLNKSDAKDMVDLAVAVLHTFTILLPKEAIKEKRLTGRTAPLVKALVESPSKITGLILQTLLTIVSQIEGSLEILRLEDPSPLIEIASQYSYVLDIFKFTWINASTGVSRMDMVRENIDQVLPALIVSFQSTDAVTLLTFVGDLLPKLDSQCLSQNPRWLQPLILLLRNLVSKRPTASGRAAYSQLAAALLQVDPSKSSKLLFMSDPMNGFDTKPFAYLFVNLLLIDLRSSFPSLLAQLNTPNYSTTSQRLAAAFDVVSGFIGFLVRSLDDTAGTFDLVIPPDLLLKLRKDLAETMSLAIEYLRDRWDASVAGAAGLDTTARRGTASTSEGTRLTLTWDTLKDDVKSDPLILAGIRTIAVWIREDDNDNLRNECAGLMDMFMELYQDSSDVSSIFRYPILLALEGIMMTEEGIDAFLAQEGWQIVSEDLNSILKNASENNINSSIPTEDNSNRGLQIVRVLLQVLDHDRTRFPEEAWMTTIKKTAGMKVALITHPPAVIELQIAMLQLSLALFDKASGGMAKRYHMNLEALLGILNQLRPVIDSLTDKNEAAELMSSLDEVSLHLENLR